ncbi:hypothetical protein GF323_02330 [Candidatus Woesearchaeota archaeon]|nr:hypothetical protein [Candidatus Woesearchaeota archaeon]
MAKIPEITKKIGSFLSKEDGRISKEKLLKAGVLLSAAALASINIMDSSADWQDPAVDNDSTAPPSIPAQMREGTCPPAEINHNQHCNDLHLDEMGSGASKGMNAWHTQSHGNHSSY